MSDAPTEQREQRSSEEERPPESPTELPKRSWWTVLRRSMKEFTDDNLGLTRDAVVLLDWDLATAGPATVDFAWYLCHDAWRIAENRLTATPITTSDVPIQTEKPA